jgi:hypothetical protein
VPYVRVIKSEKGKEKKIKRERRCVRGKCVFERKKYKEEKGMRKKIYVRKKLYMCIQESV